MVGQFPALVVFDFEAEQFGDSGPIKGLNNQTMSEQFVMGEIFELMQYEIRTA